MAEVPQPPSPSKSLLGESEPLKAYHGLMGPFFDQIRDALGSLSLRENHGALVTGATTVTAGEDGALSGVFVASNFAPLVVLFRAEGLDNSKRSTGIFIGGAASWSTSARSGEQGFQVTKAPGLAENASYSVTFLALAG